MTGKDVLELLVVLSFMSLIISFSTSLFLENENEEISVVFFSIFFTLFVTESILYYYEV